MCINLQTSIIAFLIGEISGFLLTQKSEDKKPAGLFIMFFSLVQLCEAIIYYNYNYDVSIFFKRMILINLGFQGLVFFTLMNQIFIIPNIYLIFTGIIAILSIYVAFTNNYNKEDINKKKCFRWEFLNSDFTLLLLIFMYLLIFYWLFTTKLKRVKNINISYDFYYKVGIIFIATFIISLLLSNECSLSFWCLVSALVSPLLLII